MIPQQDVAFLSKDCDVKSFQVVNVIQLLTDGMTVPFISRYRKEKTGNLDELKVNLLHDKYQYLCQLNERKQTVLNTIDQQGKLTEELQARIQAIYSKTELEDVYLPYKPKRRTKATIAREKGLDKLAAMIRDPQETRELTELAHMFLSEEHALPTEDDVLDWVNYILIEGYAENASLRQSLRNYTAANGVLTVSVTDEWSAKRSKFETYYDYSEPIRTIPSHRILAIRRGENENVLKSKIDIDKDALRERFRSLVLKKNHPRFDHLDAMLALAIKGKIFPSISLDIHKELKEKADEEAITVFANNLEKVLLAAPAGNLRVMGVDPGFRTGCKIVVLDETAKLIDWTTIYPNKPKSDFKGAGNTIAQLVKKHGIQAIAIGNGTASRETRGFIKSVVPDTVIVSVVSEAGASVYSASEEARVEFPDQDVTVRGAVSIGRRFQDPLAELVKIPPKSIGVGQYQHDVNQSLLRKKLDTVVSSVVNRVGVEVNTASQQLLKYVSGIGESTANNIVAYRDAHGMFSKREELLKVRMFGAKAFQLSAGFLRLRKGSNPLDATGIHPESYHIVTAMCRKLDTTTDQLIGNKALLKRLNAEDFITKEFGIPTIQDILKELKNPGRDPREEFELFAFADGIETINDIKDGMVLSGVVTNVTNFGAFVDIGVHQDGLVHISQLARRFVKNPHDVVSVGDKVSVKVMSVDTERNRIQLSIKETQPPHDNPPKQKSPPPKR